MTTLRADAPGCDAVSLREGATDFRGDFLLDFTAGSPGTIGIAGNDVSSVVRDRVAERNSGVFRAISIRCIHASHRRWCPTASGRAAFHAG